MTNPRSASNKLSTIRNKYGIPIHPSGSGAAKSAGPAAADDASVPKTSSAKVTKAKVPPKAKVAKKQPVKKATAKGKKAVKKEPTPEEDDGKTSSSLSEHESDEDGPADGKLNDMTNEEHEALVHTSIFGPPDSPASPASEDSEDDTEVEA